jgi:ankyrin repeat protein
MNSDRCQMHHLIDQYAKTGDQKTLSSLSAQISQHNVNQLRWGFTPLHIACQYGMLDVVDILLHNGADFTIETKKDSSRAIHLACKHPNVVQRLIQAGERYDITQTKPPHYSPLQISCSVGCLDTCKLLLSLDVDGHSYNADHHPLHIAARNGLSDIIELMVDKGIDINIKSSASWTALHFAASENHLACLKVIIQKGANVVATNNGQTVYDIAQQYHYMDMVEFLKAYFVQEEDMVLPTESQPEIQHEEKSLSEVSTTFYSFTILGETNQNNKVRKRLLKISNVNNLDEIKLALLKDFDISGSTIDMYDFEFYVKDFDEFVELSSIELLSENVKIRFTSNTN